MTKTVAERLRERDITIPEPPPSGDFHLPIGRTGNLLFVSGQQPIVNGERRFIGRVGAEISPEDGRRAARVCGLNMIGQVSKALDGDLERIVRCVKLWGYVNAAPDFLASPDVIHGASELVIDVFGEERGLHARVALGAGPLPFNVAAIVDGVWEVA